GVLAVSVPRLSCLRPDSCRDNSSRFLGTLPQNRLQVILNVNFSFHQKPDHLLALPAFHNLFCRQSLRLAFKFMSKYKSPRSVLLGVTFTLPIVILQPAFRGIRYPDIIGLLLF